MSNIKKTSSINQKLLWDSGGSSIDEEEALNDNSGQREKSLNKEVVLHFSQIETERPLSPLKVLLCIGKLIVGPKSNPPPTVRETLCLVCPAGRG